jgi:hypothetical protein
VKATQLGIFAEFAGVMGSQKFGIELSQVEWDAICKAFPRDGFKGGVKETLCGFCRSKPANTFDNFTGDLGKMYDVEGYNRRRMRFIDVFEAMEH